MAIDVGNFENINSALDFIEKQSLAEEGGQFTIFRFGSHWKVMMGVPSVDAFGRLEIGHIEPSETLSGAISNCLKNTEKDTEYRKKLLSLTEDQRWDLLREGLKK